MSNYRRIQTPGATYFFTVVTYGRQPILCHEAVRFSLRLAIEQIRPTHPFSIDAWVLLPDHMHCIWVLPDGDGDFSIRWAKIKQFVTVNCQQFANKNDFDTSKSQRRRREGGIWQRRFWEHRIRDDFDFEKHMDYIHYNPVKHGLASHAGGWEWSTFHRYVASGVYPHDWCGIKPSELSMNFGEDYGCLEKLP